MTTSVSFPIAKLLKEKGFNKNVRQRWCIVENIDGDTSPFCQYDCGLYNWNNGRYPEYISAPTIAEVVMWLYEKHGIGIQVSISRYGIFYCNILKKENTRSLDNPISWEMQVQLNDFNSPTEAYEAAIKYVLTNLI